MGTRNANAAISFVADLAERLAGRTQLTSDGYGLYLRAVEEAFGDNVDYAMLVKTYGHPEGPDSERPRPKAPHEQKRPGD